MQWLVDLVPVLIIAGFAYGAFGQIKESIVVAKSVPWDSTNDKRIIVGSHLLTFSYAGFVLALIVNLAVYNYAFPQPASTANAASLTAFYCLLMMFVAELGIMPKRQGPKKLYSIR
ncbi:MULTISPECIES: hypothetical protein [unclassified Planococcus (in: firmicutes)]|uniref:hypothetical protein n=1 Tax=Planococcus TaxID=1372 RepID=UPI000C7A869F|nr:MULTISPECIES: hypothetical protein [unclassified Planococcus (in: firmicutes)]PKG44834.1 hypothetical protein CXF66_13450 [Planococcus sp. Urea-trap-24]PKG87176.1 hypothetical protein CXF91_14290 [Planococcus sp. Urea-3u-39]PKH40280.1 hypothetical protein CXF77_08565 [Planococcus sp. MB-3u-09]